MSAVLLREPMNLTLEVPKDVSAVVVSLRLADSAPAGDGAGEAEYESWSAGVREYDSWGA